MNLFAPSLVDKIGISNTENCATEVMVTDLIIMHSTAKNYNPNSTLLLGRELGRMEVWWELIMIVNIFYIWLGNTYYIGQHRSNQFWKCEAHWLRCEWEKTSSFFSKLYLSFWFSWMQWKLQPDFQQAPGHLLAQVQSLDLLSQNIGFGAKYRLDPLAFFF